MINSSLFNNLGTLPLVNNSKTRSITAENPEGKKGSGGTAVGKLGRSRKGSPCIKGLKSGAEKTLAEIEGPGIIQHIWITVTNQTEAGEFVLRDLVLKMFWDEEEFPSVEVPLGDFFCNGFARGCLVNSVPIVVNPKRGMNSFFPMPFQKKAKIVIENQHQAEIPAFFYQIDYSLEESLPEQTAYFHAQWRREKITTIKEDYVVLDNVEGKGHYVGTYLALSALERYWWGEGELKIFLDGDQEYPTICGTGTEDYFGGAWSFARREAGRTVEQTYNTPFMGYPYYSRHDSVIDSDYFNDDCPPMRGFYRWHIMDPIRFEKNIKVTLQQIGVCERGLFERSDDVSTVAYWYQKEPHNKFDELKGREDRWPR